MKRLGLLAAEQGRADSQWSVAVRYAEGKGVPENLERIPPPVRKRRNN